MLHCKVKRLQQHNKNIPRDVVSLERLASTMETAVRSTTNAHGGSSGKESNVGGVKK